VLNGKSFNEVVQGRLAEEPKLANPCHKPLGPNIMAEAMRAVQSAEVSRPDTHTHTSSHHLNGQSGIIDQHASGSAEVLRDFVQLAHW
jgi:hypothetical protein